MTFDLLPSDEQDEIAGAARAVLSRSPGADRAAEWARYAELGWFGLGLPEAFGGVGYGLVEESLLHRVIGWHLTPGPLLATTLAAGVAAGGGDQALADELLTGQRTAAFAIGDPDGMLLVDAGDDSVLVAVTPERTSIFAADAVADRHPQPCIDETTTLEQGRISGPARVVVEGEATWLRMLVLAAATLTGIAERARDLSVQHATDREQFGKPIGANQAVKHPCADMALRAELAAAQVLVAANVIDGGDPLGRVEALSAVVVAVHAAKANAQATVQIHGGIGFTAAHPAHTLVARAWVLDRVSGGRTANLAALLAAAPPAGRIGAR